MCLSETQNMLANQNLRVYNTQIMPNRGYTPHRQLAFYGEAWEGSESANVREKAKIDFCTQIMYVVFIA